MQLLIVLVGLCVLLVGEIEGKFLDSKKCFHSLIMKGSGEMTADGTVNVEEMLAKLITPGMPNRDTMVEAIKTCGGEKGDDDCDTANRIYKCLLDKKVF